MFPFWRKSTTTTAEKLEPAHSASDGSPAQAAVPVLPDVGPWFVREWVRPGSIALQSKDPRHEVALIVDGMFDSPEARLAYANDLAAWMNQKLAQPAPEPEVRIADTVPSPAESTAMRLNDVPEPELTQVDAPGRADFAGAGRVEPVLDAAHEPVAEIEAPQSIGQRVTKLIHSTSFPLGRKPADIDRPREHVPVRVEKPAQELEGVVCEPMPEVPVRALVDEGPCACHFDLHPDQLPDACVIDLGHPECCTIAHNGVPKELCPHWQPIRIVRRAAGAQ